MKKILLVVAVAGIMTSCKDKKKTEEPTPTTPTTTEQPTTPTTSEPAPSTGGVPSFKDADVQAYAQAYADYADAYKKAAESKDMSKFADLSKMGQDLASKSVAMSQKLTATPEDAKKLSDFIVAKTNEIAEYTKKLTGM